MTDETSSSQKKLEEEILADARRRADRIIKRAKREAEKIAEQGEKAAQEEAKRIIARFAERAERMAAVARASVDIEIEKKRLARQEQAIQSIFEEAMKKLGDKRSYDYKTAVINLASYAIRKMAGNDLTIRLDKSDKTFADNSLVDAIKERVKEKAINLKVSSSASSIGAGVLVESADGRQLYDNSFEKRLKRLREPLRKKVADIIFGEHGERRE